MRQTPLKRRTPLKAKPRSGLCECGCGQPTRIAPSSWASRGWIKGEPVRFVSGHNAKARHFGLYDYSIQAGPLLSHCFVHRKTPNSKGYVQVRLDGRLVSAHREMYERIVGPIPPELQLDHLCRNRRCVNPGHLEPVTCKENIVRGHEARRAA